METITSENENGIATTPSKRTLKKYSKEFKRDVLARIKNGESIPPLSRELNISEATLYTWKKPKKYKSVTKDIKPPVIKTLPAQKKPHIQLMVDVIQEAVEKLNAVSQILSSLYK